MVGQCTQSVDRLIASMNSELSLYKGVLKLNVLIITCFFEACSSAVVVSWNISVQRLITECISVYCSVAAIDDCCVAISY